MSRSHHATHASLARLLAEDWSDDERRRKHARRLRAEIADKRAAKRQRRRQRRGALAGHAPTPIDAIPVRVEGARSHVHHAVGPDDVRVVLSRLPRGVTDGLAEVGLRCGTERSEEQARKRDSAPPRDPFLGRPGVERLPGVFSGVVRGTYRPGSASVDVYAYVHDPAHPRRDVWAILLKLWALGTLVHEVAHHHDFTSRMRRGRWLGRNRERVEVYAESRQHEWTHAVILPYLRERYPDEVRVLEGYVAEHGGVRLPLEALADDPRLSGDPRHVAGERLFFTMECALDTVLRYEAKGAGIAEQRLAFAREIHYRGDYGQALESIERVLAECPGHPAALVLRADVLVHQERYGAAVEIARSVVRDKPAEREAWKVLGDALERLDRWPEALAAWETVVALTPEDSPFDREMALRARGRARARTGDFAGAREDVAALAESGRRNAAIQAGRLQAEIEEAERSRSTPPPDA